MDAKTTLYAATDDNLIKYALEPAMRWLIATALDRSTITYGEIKRRLEREASFSTIFATRIGLVAGELMNSLQRVEPDAPLINVLVVNQLDRQPSKGAGSFMADRFGNRRLKEDTYKERYPDKWQSYFERAADEVYDYSPEKWAHLYRRRFGNNLDFDEIQSDRTKRQDGNEDDFGAGPGKYGSDGESKYHRNLRLWVKDNPDKLNRSYVKARTETEVDLDSGDRVDVVYRLPNRTLVIEVKSRISNEIDLRRGVFQCIKYRAVAAAMDVRESAPVDAMLVTERTLPGEISSLLRIHGVMHYQAHIDGD